MKSIHPEQEVLTLKQAAIFIGVSMHTLRNWDNDGRLKAVRFGPRKDRRYRKKDLIKFINQ